MHSPVTLQDFVLNLIYDPAARSAFELDPESTLHHAGLGDITAADVQQVIPLVVDSAPVTGLNTPYGGDDLATGVANLDVAGAVSHLQAITAHVGATTSLTGDLGVVGATNSLVSSTALTGSGLNASVLSGTDLHLGSLHAGLATGAATSADLGGLSAGTDPGLHLDGGVAATVETPVTQTHAEVQTAVDHSASGLDTGLIGGLDSVAGLPSALPDLDATGVGGAVSSIGSVVSPDLGHALSGDPVAGLHDTVTGVTGGHDVTGDLLHGVTHPAEHDPVSDLLGGLH